MVDLFSSEGGSESLFHVLGESVANYFHSRLNVVSVLASE
jgi:hypothetical protein